MTATTSIQVPTWFKLSAAAAASVLVAGSVVPLFTVCSGVFQHPPFVEKEYGGYPWSNAAYLLNVDNELGTAVWRSIQYSFASVVGQVLLGSVLAFAVHHGLSNAPSRHKEAIKVLLLNPYLVLAVVAVEIFRWLVQLTDIVPLGTNATIDFGVLIVISIWQFTPFAFLFVLAGLEGIPENQLSAVEVETPRYFVKLRYLLLPSVRRLLFAIFILRFVWMFTKFETAYFFADQLPTRHDTLILPVYVNRYLVYYKYDNLYPYWQSGTAIVLMIVVELTMLSLFWFVFRGQDSEYLEG